MLVAVTLDLPAQPGEDLRFNEVGTAPTLDGPRKVGVVTLRMRVHGVVEPTARHRAGIEDIPDGEESDRKGVQVLLLLLVCEKNGKSRAPIDRNHSTSIFLQVLRLGPECERAMEKGEATRAGKTPQDGDGLGRGLVELRLEMCRVQPTVCVGEVRREIPAGGGSAHQR